jgi:hypothetical protein
MARDHRREVPGVPSGVAYDRSPERGTDLPRPPQRRSPLGLPGRTPRLLATASASLVHLEIASRSACATGVMIKSE